VGAVKLVGDGANDIAAVFEHVRASGSPQVSTLSQLSKPLHRCMFQLMK
jgi:hypothetical protein